MKKETCPENTEPTDEEVQKWAWPTLNKKEQTMLKAIEKDPALCDPAVDPDAYAVKCTYERRQRLARRYLKTRQTKYRDTYASTVPGWVQRQRALTDANKRLISEIAHLQSGKGCWLSNEGLALRLAITPCAVHEQIKNLKKKKLLSSLYDRRERKRYLLVSSWHPPRTDIFFRPGTRSSHAIVMQTPFRAEGRQQRENAHRFFAVFSGIDFH